MKAVFIALYAVHPVAPLLFLLILGNGMLAPALYHAMAKVPFSIEAIQERAKGGSLSARYAYYSWLLLASTSCLVVLLRITQ